MIATGNQAAAYGVLAAKAEVVAAYPITPQTQIIEKIAELIDEGKMSAKYLRVESEHSAMSACIGASACGARTFTATSSQGLAYMNEMLFWAGLGSFPVVMAVVTRALAPPWNIWNEHTDLLAQRDTGWIMIMCESVQEVYDTMIQSFRIAEDARVRQPVMVGLDAFSLSHTSEKLELIGEGEAGGFLPPPEGSWAVIDFSDPATFGNLAGPERLMEIRHAIKERLDKSLLVIEEIASAFGKASGRAQAGAVEAYKTGDAEIKLVLTGASAGDAKDAVDMLREEGVKAGLVRMKVLRPFPSERLKAELSGGKAIAVVDRDYSFGFGGILGREVASVVGGEGLQLYRRAWRGGLAPKTLRAYCDGRIREGRVGREWGGDLVGDEGGQEQVTVRNLSKEEYFLPGNASCPGCAAVMALRIALKVLGPRTVLVIPACCISVVQGNYPKTPSKVPIFNTAFAAAASTASGIRAALDMRGIKDANVVCWAGDGGTADIGIQSLSGAAERGEDLIYICYDNEAYMNTGTQRSGCTPEGATTTTTTRGKPEIKKDVPGIMIAHRVPYVATACAAYPLDFANKVRKAMRIKGLRYIHILSPCPPGWKYPAEKTVEVGRLAVETGAWILYEWAGGRLSLTGPSKGLADSRKRRPLEDYLSSQGRYSKLGPEKIRVLKERIDREWSRVLEACREDGILRGW